MRGTPAGAAVVYTDFSKLPVYGNGTLSAGIRMDYPYEPQKPVLSTVYLNATGAQRP